MITRVPCDAEGCQETIRQDQAEKQAYIRLNDGTYGYACERHYREWEELGMLYVRSQEG